MNDPYESPQVDPFADEAPEGEAGIEPAVAAEAADVEHLGPLHFLLFGAGLLLAWSMSPVLRQAVEIQQFDAVRWTDLVMCLLAAPALAAIALAAWRRHERAHTFPTQAGHWLLLLQGAAAIAFFVVTTDLWRSLLTGLRNADSPHFELHTRIENVLLWAAAIVVPGMALYYVRREMLWRIYFAAWLVHYSSYSLLHITVGMGGFGRFWMWEFLFAAHVLLGGVLSLLFLIAAVRDLGWRRGGKDAVHWLGLACQLGLMVLARFSWVPGL